MWRQRWSLRKDKDGRTILWLLATLAVTLAVTLLAWEAATVGLDRSLPESATAPISKGVSNQFTATSTPKRETFKVHSCFHRDGMREPWESDLPDGIIIMRGYQKYLVMFREEAEKRGGHPKWSQEIMIEQFDRTHHLIACPFEWANHNRRGGRDAESKNSTVRD